MLESYLKAALRNMARDLRYALINVLGLAVGMAGCIVVALYLQTQLTYDRHFAGHERIFRVVTEMHVGDRIDLAASSSTELGPLLAADYGEVDEFVRFVPVQQQQILRHEDLSFYWDSILLADPHVFDVFSHDVLLGDPATALTDPLSIAISATMARRYFGEADPIGATLATDTASYRVTLVFADLPENTHLRYDALLSYNRIKAFQGNVNVSQALWNLGGFSYLRLQPGLGAADFEPLAADFYERYMRSRGDAIGSRVRFRLEPLADVHLHSAANYDRPKGSPFYVYAFAGIAAFLLGVASINYMNLATARASGRAMEVGMRKVLGAQRGQLIRQFVGESLVYAGISLLVALVLVQLVLTFTPIEALLGRTLTLDPTGQPWVIGGLVLLAVVVGILAGCYPALYLSAIMPLAALEGGVAGGSDGRLLRQALVFVQFVVSVGVVACTLLMAGQLHYVQKRALGFDKDDRLIVRLQGADVIEDFATIRNRLSSHHGVRGVALTNQVPGYDPGFGESAWVMQVQLDDAAGVLEPQTVNGMAIGTDFLEVMGMELVAGRGFDENSRWQTEALVNETLVRRMGWQDAIGRRVQNDGPLQARVIGVVRDFHFASLHDPIEPLVMSPVRADYSGIGELNRAVAWSLLVVAIEPGQTAAVLEYLGELWPDIDPRHPLEYTFVADEWDNLYDSERRQMLLIGAFATICVLVSCLGLYGLAAFTTAQRSREIVVRRILGASAGSIVMLLFRNVLWLIVAAAAVASCLSYLLIGEWLAGFEYRRPIDPLAFLAATGVAAALAFATVAAQALKSLRAEPAAELRGD